MKVRDRVVSLERVKASDLIANDKNWREHPDRQRVALSEAMEALGCADALIARRTKGKKLELIDGHLRASLAGDQEVPVLVIDVTEAEAAKLLATIDPLSKMADVDPAALAELLATAELAGDRISEMYHQMRSEAGLVALGESAPSAVEELCVDEMSGDCICPECGFEFSK